MSMDSATAFFAAMMQDEEMLELASRATESRKGPERADALAEVAADRGYDVTADEVREVHRVIGTISELSEEELSGVSGGTAFQNFDQKSNQIYNMLSSVMKAMNEMELGTINNML